MSNDWNASSRIWETTPPPLYAAESFAPSTSYGAAPNQYYNALPQQTPYTQHEHYSSVQAYPQSSQMVSGYSFKPATQTPAGGLQEDASLVLRAVNTLNQTLGGLDIDPALISALSKHIQSDHASDQNLTRPEIYSPTANSPSPSPERQSSSKGFEVDGKKLVSSRPFYEQFNHYEDDTSSKVDQFSGFVSRNRSIRSSERRSNSSRERTWAGSPDPVSPRQKPFYQRTTHEYSNAGPLSGTRRSRSPLGQSSRCSRFEDHFGPRGAKSRSPIKRTRSSRSPIRRTRSSRSPIRRTRSRSRGNSKDSKVDNDTKEKVINLIGMSKSENRKFVSAQQSSSVLLVINLDSWITDKVLWGAIHKYARDFGTKPPFYIEKASFHLSQTLGQINLALIAFTTKSAAEMCMMHTKCELEVTGRQKKTFKMMYYNENTIMFDALGHKFTGIWRAVLKKRCELRENSDDDAPTTNEKRTRERSVDTNEESRPRDRSSDTYDKRRPRDQDSRERPPEAIERRKLRDNLSQERSAEANERIRLRGHSRERSSETKERKSLRDNFSRERTTSSFKTESNSNRIIQSSEKDETSSHCRETSPAVKKVSEEMFPKQTEVNLPDLPKSESKSKPQANIIKTNVLIGKMKSYLIKQNKPKSERDEDDVHGKKSESVDSFLHQESLSKQSEHGNKSTITERKNNVTESASSKLNSSHYGNSKLDATLDKTTQSNKKQTKSAEIINIEKCDINTKISSNKETTENILLKEKKTTVSNETKKDVENFEPKKEVMAENTSETKESSKNPENKDSTVAKGKASPMQKPSIKEKEYIEGEESKNTKDKLKSNPEAMKINRIDLSKGEGEKCVSNTSLQQAPKTPIKTKCPANSSILDKTSSSRVIPSNHKKCLDTTNIIKKKEEQPQDSSPAIKDKISSAKMSQENVDPTPKQHSKKKESEEVLVILTKEQSQNVISDKGADCPQRQKSTEASVEQPQMTFSRKEETNEKICKKSPSKDSAVNVPSEKMSNIQSKDIPQKSPEKFIDKLQTEKSFKEREEELKKVSANKKIDKIQKEKSLRDAAKEPSKKSLVDKELDKILSRKTPENTIKKLDITADKEDMGQNENPSKDKVEKSQKSLVDKKVQPLKNISADEDLGNKKIKKKEVETSLFCEKSNKRKTSPLRDSLRNVKTKKEEQSDEVDDLFAPQGEDPECAREREEEEAELFGKGLDKYRNKPNRFQKKGSRASELNDIKLKGGWNLDRQDDNPYLQERCRSREDRFGKDDRRRGGFRQDNRRSNWEHPGHYDKRRRGNQDNFDDIDGNEDDYWSKNRDSLKQPPAPAATVNPWIQNEASKDKVSLSLKELRDPEFLLRVLLQTSIMIQNNQLTMANPLDSLTPTDKDLIIQTLNEIDATSQVVIYAALNDKSKFNAAENRVLVEALSNVHNFKAALLPPGSMNVNEKQNIGMPSENFAVGNTREEADVYVSMTNIKKWITKDQIIRQLNDFNLQYDFVEIYPQLSNEKYAHGYIKFKDIESATELLRKTNRHLYIGKHKEGIELNISDVTKKVEKWTCNSCSMRNSYETIICLKCQKLKEKLQDVTLTTDVTNRLALINFKRTTTVDEIKNILKKIAPFLNANVVTHVDSTCDQVLHFLIELPNPQACSMIKKCIRDNMREFSEIRAGPRVAISFILPDAPNNNSTSQQRVYTFADVPRLAHYSASLYATTEVERIKYFQHYTTLYTQELIQGNPINVVLPEDTHTVITTTTTTQNSGAPNGTDGRTWAPPNVSAFTYDQNSGYYYDHSTGLYYEASSQYFYNMETGKFLQYDTVRSTYTLVQSSEISSAPVKTFQGSSVVNKTNVSGLPIENAIQDDQTTLKNAPSKESKIHAKKVMKDLEKWSKTVKKQDKRKAIQNVFNQDPDAIDKSSPADVCFDILRKTENSKPGLSTVQSISSLIMDNNTVCEDEEEEYAFIDWKNFTCNLCHRVFNNADILNKHSRLSDLHKNNLKQWYISKNLDPDNEENRKQQYRDRASERRNKSSGKAESQAQAPAESWLCSTPGCMAYKRSGFSTCFSCEKNMDSRCSRAPTSQQYTATVPDMSVGSQLLKKMGWEQGTGLGKTGQGNRNPINVEKKTGYGGLGAQKEEYREDGESYVSFIRRSTQKRFQQISDRY